MHPPGTRRMKMRTPTAETSGSRAGAYGCGEVSVPAGNTGIRVNTAAATPRPRRVCCCSDPIASTYLPSATTSARIRASGFAPSIFGRSARTA
jgi:hypothetical protein